MAPLPAHWISSRRVLVIALSCACVPITVLTLMHGLSLSFPVRLVQVVVCSVAVVLVAGVIMGGLTARLSNYQAPADDDEFERLLQRSERLAAENLAAEPDEEEFLDWDPQDPHQFAGLVREALDDLPDILLRALRHVAVVVSDDGHRYGAYGLYQGDTVASDRTADRVVIFRDTLVRDFGADVDELREQVTRTVRHELAHHLGADELGVRDLGL